MDANKQTPPGSDEQLEEAAESLDGPSTEVDSPKISPDNPADSTGIVDATSTSGVQAPGELDPKKGKKSLKQRLSAFNLYFLLFLLILVLAGAIAMIAYFQSKSASNTATLKSDTLTQQSLQQVASSDASIGNAQQVLNVQSSAVFAGKVLIRDGLEVAGNLQIGGTVALSNITVSGTSQLGQVQISKNLSVAGDTALQGAVSITKSIQVNGGGTFNGPVSAPQITTSSLQLNSDLVLTRHIITGGGTPGRSNGVALGSGGTSSVSGSDTGGSITINTGSNPPAGCFVTITFTAKYNSVPHVLLTPVGSAGGGLAYYINRDTSGFTICDASPPPAGSSFGFDYFVVN